MTLKWIGPLIVLLAANAVLPASARPGVVETRDRKTYRGFLRLEPEGITVIHLERDLLVRVDATNVLQVFLHRDDSSQTLLNPASAVGQFPPGWEEVDIGGATAPGSASHDNGGFHLSGIGTNLLARHDSFHFVYQSIRGNADIVARLRGVSFTGFGGLAGLMMRESLADDAVSVFLGSTARQTGLFNWRDRRSTEPRIREHAARYYPWIRLKRTGGTVTGYRSRDGRRWYPVEKITLSLRENLLVGLALASMNDPMPASALFDSVRHGHYLTFGSYRPRVDLRSGSTVLGTMDSVDDREVRFGGPLPKAPVPLRDVTSLRFRPVPWRAGRYLRAGDPGVLLTSGEFLEGDIKEIADGVVTVSSVLFGLRQFECDTEVTAVVFRKPSPLPGRCELVTIDGSVWKGTELKLGYNEVLLQEAAVGPRSFPVHEISDFGWKVR